jgi:hypothetical protein
MGLDIYHFYATHRPDPQKFCRVAPFLTAMMPLESYFQEHENEHLDWEKMFASHGLDHRKYRVMARTTDGRYTCVVFVDADSAGANGPVRAIFSNERPAVFRFLQRSRFRLPLPKSATKDALRVFGPFATIMKRETVVFYEPAGYQRNGVSDAFYHQFPPDDVTCSRERVEMIYDATLPESRDGFKRQFLDNWDRDRSFVLISY